MTTLASLAFGPPSEDVLDVAELPGLVREGLQAAARWPDFDAEGFGAELAGLLRDATERDTVAAITSYLLTSGGYDPGCWPDGARGSTTWMCLTPCL